MKLFDELIRVTKLLSAFPGQWAICGGVAASIYRKRARFTDDIDIALIDSAGISAKNLASKIINELGYKEYQGFVPDTAKNNQQVLGLICARGIENEKFVGLDFLLPVQFWVQSAVEIAQANLIDYGFASLPTITPENLIIAKLIAVTGTPDRYQDLDDIKEIINSVSINRDYIKDQIKYHNLSIADELLKMVITV